MISSHKFTGVLDTCVMYPVLTRDLIFSIAQTKVFTIKWSKHIFDELEAVMKKKGMKESQIKRMIEVSNKAFPDALVKNYESLIGTLDLPDPKDHHVLAAAIKTNANVIVTHNLKHFPSSYLKSFDLEVKSPDDFLTDAIDLDIHLAVDAFRKMVSRYKNPPLDENVVISMLKNNDLEQTAMYLYSQL